MKNSFTLIVVGIFLFFVGFYTSAPSSQGYLHLYGLGLVWFMTAGLSYCLWFIINARIARANELKKFAKTLSIQYASRLPRLFGRRWFHLDQSINAVCEKTDKFNIALFDLCRETGIPQHTVLRVMSNNFQFPEFTIQPRRVPILSQLFSSKIQRELDDEKNHGLFDYVGEDSFFEQLPDNFKSLLIHNPNIAIKSKRTHIDFYYAYTLLPTRRYQQLKNLAINFIDAANLQNTTLPDSSLVY